MRDESDLIIEPIAVTQLRIRFANIETFHFTTQSSDVNSTT